MSRNTISNLVLLSIAVMAASATFMAQSAGAQVVSEIAFGPIFCADELGQINVSYTVRHTFSNTGSSPVRVRLGLFRSEAFYLFKLPETSDPASAVFVNNPDPVSPLAARNHLVKAGAPLVWTRRAMVLIAGGAGANGLPEPGMYYMRVFPDMEIVGPHSSQAADGSEWQSLQLTIPKPTGKLPGCKR